MWPRGRSPWGRLVTSLALLCVVGCGGAGRDSDPIVSSIEGSVEQEFPQDEEPGRFRIEVSSGHLPQLEEKASRLPAGPSVFNVVNKVDGARADVEGLDLSERAVALWIRGRGPARHRLPQFSIGPVNSGVQEDWPVELPPGDYLLSLTMGGNSEAIVVVR